MFELPILYCRDSKGKIREWHIAVEHCDGFSTLVTVHGAQNGKMQTDTDTITKGKNLGKANATTPATQAELEATAAWTYQIERKGYVENLENVDIDIRPGIDPMLAHRFDKCPEKVIYPCYVQPKLNGHRCIAVLENGACSLYSRQRELITGVPHINSALVSLFRGAQRLILDGELYHHDFRDDFEAISSFVRSKEPIPGHEIMQYHVYDCPSLKEPFWERQAFLDANFPPGYTTGSEKVLGVPAFTAKTPEKIMEYHKQFVKDGYEGAMPSLNVKWGMAKPLKPKWTGP